LSPDASASSRGNGDTMVIIPVTNTKERIREVIFPIIIDNTYQFNLLDLR